MIWLPGNGSRARGGDHPMPSLAATTSSLDPYPSTEMVRLAEDGAMFKIARFEKQFRHASGHSPAMRRPASLSASEKFSRTLETCDGAIAIAQRRHSRSLVILVVNCEIGAPAQANAGGAAIRCGKPEIAHSGVDLFDFRVFCPQGRVFRGLSFQTHDRKVLCIDPDSTAVKELVLSSRLNGKNVERAGRRTVVPDLRELVVITVESGAPWIFVGERLFLALQQLLEYPVDE